MVEKDIYFFSCTEYSSSPVKIGVSPLMEEEIYDIYPLVNKTGENYSPDDNWAYWLGRMNTYTFENISFSYLNDEGERETTDSVIPTKPIGELRDPPKMHNLEPGRFVINAFTLAQARNILLANIMYYGIVYHDPRENKNVRDIKYRVGPSYIGFKKGIGSDCDPETWPSWEEYINKVFRKLAFERGLIPKGTKEFFSKYRNAVEILEH